MNHPPLVTNPITIFFIVLVIIVLAPVLLNRLKIPHIVGMIIAGVIIGPHGINLLADDSSFIIFGQVGLLYLMFLAGLEIDMFHLQLNFKKGILFGILTLMIPLIMGILGSHYILKLDLLTSSLLGAMFAAHTLISYPVAARYGVTKSTAVVIAVVGTIIAVVGSLLLLASVMEITKEGSFKIFEFGWLILKMIIYGIGVGYFYPVITKIFLKRYNERVTQYVFILALVFLSAWISELIGLSGVLGAFYAGLILNRYVPPTSPLMSRIEFVGNAIFIPYFLIGVGMMVNLHLLTNIETLTVALIMLAIALVSKWFAAYMSRRIYKMSGIDGQIIFGLTTAHTAVALAVVTIGYVTFLPNGERMLDERIMNATILVILVTCALAPIITAQAASKIRLRMIENEENAIVSRNDPKKIKRNNIMVPVSNPITAPGIMELAILLAGKKKSSSNVELSVLHVRNDNSPKSRTIGRTCIENAIQISSATDIPVNRFERFDINTVTGITNMIHEKEIDTLVMGMHRKSTIVDTMHGPIIEKLLSQTHNTIVITRCYAPINTLNRIIVYAPPRAQFEKGFSRWVILIGNLASELGCKVVICSPADMRPAINSVLRNERYNFRLEFKLVNNSDDFVLLVNKIDEDDLFIWIAARAGSVSWANEQKELPSFMSKYLQRNNIIVVYPEVTGDGLSYQSFAEPLTIDYNFTNTRFMRRPKLWIYKMRRLFG